MLAAECAFLLSPPFRMLVNDWRSILFRHAGFDNILVHRPAMYQAHFIGSSHPQSSHHSSPLDSPTHRPASTIIMPPVKSVVLVALMGLVLCATAAPIHSADAASAVALTHGEVVELNFAAHNVVKNTTNKVINEVKRITKLSTPIIIAIGVGILVLLLLCICACCCCCCK